ncbi:Mth938-like domain-containing protein [Aliiruegeria lutimaris]|uniref:Uncharacterized conserved protein, contains Mth938-like domain n=1 Tax=Aliiruegeria lutimaris TaxID=571298 RepID=A0A1G8IG93_9RHOB|nr:Mth938-like domain-containing protein [Aliiruegeria lutimaris]SDI17560.1 Uncharacterized conserved protein, contains Mth938-like domain [Aliiruegeria lutimaris]
MDFKEVSYPQGTPFDGYGPGFFRLGGKVHEGSLVVAPSGVHPWAGFADSATIANLREQIDFVLLGTGADMTPIPADLRRALEGAGIGIELMSTGSACRTYNVLLSEGRRLAAAVLPLPGDC